jgi:hypothetical protein
MYAVAGEHIDANPHLLNHGADVHTHGLDGKTALDLTRASTNEVAVQLISTAMKDRH